MIDIKAFRKANKISQGELADYIGVTQSYISLVEKGVNNLSFEAMKKIASNDKGWDTSFLIEKVPDEVLKKAEEEWRARQEGEEVIDIPEVSGENRYTIPLLPLSAQGGSLNDFVTSVHDYQCEKVISPISGAQMAITVSGDSMAPEFPNGSQVLVKKIDEKIFIEWGRVYVLDTANGVVIKELEPSTKGDEYIKCVSLNEDPRYAPFDVCLDSVYGIYRVMLCMSTK